MKHLTIVFAAAAALATLGLTQPASAESTNRFFFEGDMVRGEQAGAPGPFCVLTSQFKRLEKVVWRVRVVDAAGKPVDDKGLKSLVIELPDGQKISAHHDRHPPPHLGPAADHFWSAVWIIPDDYPSGTFAYKVVATGTDGHSQTWQPFMMRPSQLTIAASSIEFKK
jgi:hypothetical protein